MAHADSVRGYETSFNADTPIYPVVCEMLIRTKDGGQLKLSCRDCGVNPVLFTANGEDYFLGRSVNEQGGGIAGGLMLLKTIREAHEAGKH